VAADAHDDEAELPPWRVRAPRPVPGALATTPAVRQLLEARGIDPTTLVGTGNNGRITRDDVLSAAALVTLPRRTGRPSAETVPFDAMRRRVAQHMLAAKATAAHAHVASEVDYGTVEAVRRAVGPEWRAREGFGLTYLPFVARAVVDAIREFPNVNATVGDNALVQSVAVHLGVAVDLDFGGLIVPVIRDATSRRLRDLARTIVDVARRARARTLRPHEVTGGTFTITNPAPWGTRLSVPIVNVPQVATLATDAVTKRVVATGSRDGAPALAVRPRGMLCLGFDHRAIDGAYAAAFTNRVRQILETRAWFTEL